MNFGEIRRAQVAKSTLLTSTLGPLGSFKICSDAKESGVLKPKGSYSAVEDLPLGRNAALVSEFAVKDLPLGRTL